MKLRLVLAAFTVPVLVAGLLVVGHEQGAGAAGGYVSVPGVGNVWYTPGTGTEWLFVNDNGNGPTDQAFRRPNIHTFALSIPGADTTIAANECKAANLVDYMVGHYGLAGQGYFVGFSTNGNLLLKAIRHSPGSDVACSDRLVHRLKGIGLAGDTWRMSAATPLLQYHQGGVPYGGAWPANLTHIWWFDGAVDNLMRQDTWDVGGDSEFTPGTPTVNMHVPELWHWLASMWDPTIPTDYLAAVPRDITQPVYFDHAGAGNHQRGVVTPAPDAHTILSAVIDSDQDFWDTMLTDVPQPTTTTTSPSTSTTVAPTTAPTSSTTTTLPSTTTTTASTTTSSTTTTTQPSTTTTTTAPTTTTTLPPADPVRDALVASVAAAQHALDVYDQAHP